MKTLPQDTPINPYMFGYKEEEPDNDDYRFNEDIESYLRKTVKPEPEWISFGEREPEDGQWIYIPYDTKLGYNVKAKEKEWKAIRYSSDHAIREDLYWTDKATHYANMLYWLEHQKRYYGWDLTKWHNGIVFTKDDTQLEFYNSGHFLFTKNSKIQFTMSDSTPSIQLFDLLIKENGIEI